LRGPATRGRSRVRARPVRERRREHARTSDGDPPEHHAFLTRHHARLALDVMSA